MVVVESIVNSYDAGKVPYNHDKRRSHWYSTNDFVLACIGHCFGVRNFFTLGAYLEWKGSVIMLIPYTITLLLFVIPIFFIQSSIGQFSSTGYISAFRISPVFKGVGYVILLFNFTSVTYYCTLAAYPLLLFLKSFTWDLPWMSCRNSWNSPNCTQPTDYTFDQISTFLKISPAKEFFEKEVKQISNPNNPYEISWPLVGALFVIWLLTTGCLVCGIVTIGRALRYMAITALTILIILFIRMSFLPNTFQYFLRFLTPNMTTIRSPYVWLMSPLLGTMSLGVGWGSAMTLASYNRFKTDTEKISIVIPCAVSVIHILSGLMVHFIGQYLKERNILNIYVYNEYMFDFLWIGLPYFMGTLEAPQLWFALIYVMLFLCEISSVIVQTLSIITALFDEYVPLRSCKVYFTMGLCLLLFLLSTFFATNTGFKLYLALTYSAAFAQMMICFVEIIMVVWVYGRIRFQRDMKFMLGRTFAAWKFHIIRFITPTFVVFLAFTYLIITLFQLHAYRLGIVFTLIVKVAPWIMIPGYALYKLFATTGSLMERFRKSVRPNDWYPVESRDRQRYNEMLGSSELSHQLVDLENHDNLE